MLPLIRHALVAAVIATPALAVEETFDDEDTPLTLSFNDFDTQATGTGKAFGTAPGFTVEDGRLVFYDNSNYGDVGVAQMVPDDIAGGFKVAADVAVKSLDFTQTKFGVFAFAQGPASYNQGFAGVYAYVQEVDTSGNRYRFVLSRNADDKSVELASSGEFDLTDGSADFSIELVGTMEDGAYQLVARIIEDGDDLVAPLKATMTEAERPKGDQFGIRVNPMFNTVEIGFDNVIIGPAS
jgi:hypothetical protein